MRRVCFDSKINRGAFFEELFRSGGFRSWKEVYSSFGICKSMFEKYRFGEITLPEDLFLSFCTKLSHEKIIVFKEGISYLDERWGCSKGGKITYSTHKEIFDRGRLLGISKIKNQSNASKYKIDQNLTLNKELAYFIGLFIAEGFTNVYGRHYQTQFTGHWSEESDFYNGLMKGIVKDLFGITPYIRKEKFANAIRFNLISKDLFYLITGRFGISPGRKSYCVLIPDEIINSDRANLFYCISGIFDGEACFFVDKRKAYKNPYPRIDLHMNNPGIIKQISEIFNKEEIGHNIVGNYSNIQIYGDKKVKFFLSKIGLSNPKHLKKIEDHFGKIYVKKLI